MEPVRGLWHLAFAQIVTIRAPACFEVQSEVPQITPTLRKEMERLGHSLDPIGNGYFRLVGAPYAAYIVVTNEVSAAEHDEFLQLFSHRLPTAGAATSWFGTFATEKLMKNPELEQELSQDELLRRFVKMFSIEARLEDVPPEEICRRLTVEQLLAGLTPEKLAELIAHASPEVLEAAKKRSS